MLVPSGPVLHISVVLLGVVELCSSVGGQLCLVSPPARPGRSRVVSFFFFHFVGPARHGGGFVDNFCPTLG